MNNDNVVGSVVKAETAQGDEQFRGEVVALYNRPSVTVLDEEGERHHWILHLTSELSREEERNYWRQRASYWRTRAKSAEQRCYEQEQGGVG